MDIKELIKLAYRWGRMNGNLNDGSNKLEDFYKDYSKEIDLVNNLDIPVVVKSLPTDECVEQWWAEGQEKNKGFWHEAPYRTNGDVVGEIKIALKYFIETWQR